MICPHSTLHTLHSTVHLQFALATKALPIILDMCRDILMSSERLDVDAFITGMYELKPHIEGR